MNQYMYTVQRTAPARREGAPSQVMAVHVHEVTTVPGSGITTPGTVPHNTFEFSNSKNSNSRSIYLSFNKYNVIVSFYLAFYISV